MSAPLFYSTPEHEKRVQFRAWTPRAGAAQQRWLLACAAALAIAVCSSPIACRAQDDTPTIVGYSLQGLWTGAATGLAVGYLSTGSDFRSSEWQNIGWGTAIGALTGLGVGILLGTIDAATYGHRAGVTYYMIRDSSYGVSVGFLAGGIIGTMIWAGGGTGQDLLRGMAWGTIIGAGAGLLLGVLEGVLRLQSSGGSRGVGVGAPAREVEVYREPAVMNLHLSIGATTPELGARGAPVPYPMIVGQF